MEDRINYFKKRNKIIGFTSVVGDFLHAGHCLMLNECKRYCDYLIVGLIADPLIDRAEIKNKPIESLFERFIQLKSHSAVDEIIPLMGEKDLELALKSLPIDIRFVGSDYLNKDFTGKDLCNQLNIKIIYNSRNHPISSSEIRERVKKCELVEEK